MLKILDAKNKEELRKRIGEEVYILFEIDPKKMVGEKTARGILFKASMLRNEHKDGFYKILSDDDESFYFLVDGYKRISFEYNFIKEIYCDIQ